MTNNVGDGQERDIAYREGWHAALRDAQENGQHFPIGVMAVALSIAVRGRADGTRALASIKSLAAELGIGTATVERHLDALRESGWIRQTTRGRGRTAAGEPAQASVYALVNIAVESAYTPIAANLNSPHPGDGYSDEVHHGNSHHLDPNSHHLGANSHHLGDGPPRSPKKPPKTRERDGARELLCGHGLDASTAEAVIDAALADPDTASLGRLKVEPYLARLVSEVKRAHLKAEADQHRCVHDVHYGMTIRGHGPDASRVCGDCDVADPPTWLTPQDATTTTTTTDDQAPAEEAAS